MTNFEKHVEKRLGKLNGQQRPWKDVHIDYVNEIITFELRHLHTKQLAGIQVYNWKGEKVRNNQGRYVTHVLKSTPVVFGLEYIYDASKTVYIVEGVMDCLSLRRLGVQAIAMLSNNAPKAIKKLLLDTLPNSVAVCDGDGAGRELAKYAHDAIFLEEGNDPNSMSLAELQHVLDSYHLFKKETLC